MLTGLKVSFLPRKIVFYRPEWNAKALEIKKWNIPNDKTQWADEQMESFAYLSCFPPELWSMKCKNDSFLVFCWWQKKVSHNFSKTCKCIWKIWNLRPINKTSLETFWHTIKMISTSCWTIVISTLSFLNMKGGGGSRIKCTRGKFIKISTHA